MHPLTDRLEPCTRADLAGIAALVQAVDIAETGRTDTTEAEILHDWQSAGTDLALDTRVVRDAAGAIIANAEVKAREEGSEYDGYLDVHPEHAGGPWFAPLITWLCARVAERAAPRAARLGIYCTHGNTLKAAALEAAGFRSDRVVLRMAIDLPEPPGGASALAPGLTLSQFRPGADDEAFHHVIETAFADHYRPQPRTLEKWRADVLGDPEFRPECFLIVRDGGTALGAIEAFDRGDKVWVSRIGVLPAGRGRGIGRALLYETFARAFTAGRRRVELGVDAQNATGATALYESVGMHTVMHYELWRTEVVPA